MKFTYLDKIINNSLLENRVTYEPTVRELNGKEILLSVNKGKYVIENKHFPFDVKLNISSNSCIEIKNCIFDGVLLVNPMSSEDFNQILEVTLFKTIVSKKVNLNRVANYERIDLDCCLIGSANLTNEYIGEINIFKSEIHSICLESTIIKLLSIKDSYITKVINYTDTVEKNYVDLNSILGIHKKFNNINWNLFIDSEQLENSLSEQKMYKKILRERIFFRKKDQYNITNDDLRKNISLCKNSIQDIKKQSRINCLRYIQLFKKSNDESIDDQVISELNYLYLKNKKYSLGVYILLSMIGFFYRPSKVIILSALIVFFFGFFIFIIDLSSNATSSIFTIDCLLKLLNSIYTSGLTFFTIGTFNISPEESVIISIFKQVVTLLEAGLGIILTSTILVSFMNKYLFSYRNN